MSQQPANYRQPHYHHVEALVPGLKKGRPSHLESVIRFLEQDQYTYRSGYLKERIWRYLRRVQLSEELQERLRAVAVSYVGVRRSREFFLMCRYIRGIATDKLKEQVRALESSPEAGIRHRAGLLSAYLRSLGEGEAARQAACTRC